MKKLTFFVLSFAAYAFAQGPQKHDPPGTVTRTSESPADVGYQTSFKVDSATVNYICVAPSRRPSTKSLTISTITGANPGAATITSHGFAASATPLVYITGGTGDWAAVNGLRVLTYVDANTMSIGVDTTAFAAFGAQALTVTTFAVAESDELWSIKKLIYDGSGNFIWSGWAAGAASSVTNGDPRVGGRPSYSFACSSRTTYGYE